MSKSNSVSKNIINEVNASRIQEIVRVGQEANRVDQVVVDANALGPQSLSTRFSASRDGSRQTYTEEDAFARDTASVIDAIIDSFSLERPRASEDAALWTGPKAFWNCFTCSGCNRPNVVEGTDYACMVWELECSHCDWHHIYVVGPYLDEDKEHQGRSLEAREAIAAAIPGAVKSLERAVANRRAIAEERRRHWIEMNWESFSQFMEYTPSVGYQVNYIDPILENSGWKDPALPASSWADAQD